MTFLQGRNVRGSDALAVQATFSDVAGGSSISYWLMVDTGSTDIILYKEEADRLITRRALLDGRPARIVTLTSRVDVYRYVSPRIVLQSSANEVFGVTGLTVYAAHRDASDNDYVDDELVAGVLGLSFFRKLYEEMNVRTSLHIAGPAVGIEIVPIVREPQSG